LHSDALPRPQDRTFQGNITLLVDATDTRHGIIATHETIPVQEPGEMILMYPEWETASHAPTAPAASLAGLVIQIDGHRVEWRRDPHDIRAFHVPLPAGARLVTIDLQYIADRGAMRDDRLNLPWQRVLLYPAGWYARDIPVDVSARLPDGMTAVTALAPLASSHGLLRFAPVPLDRLSDAPLYAARHINRIDVTSKAPPFRLDLIATDPADLAISDQDLARMRALVSQTSLVFGPPPFRHYDAIVTLDDAMGAGGIEHLEEGENNLPAHYFTKPAEQLNNLDLIAHELVHAWNGRFRQPRDLWTPAFNQSVGGSLLWVYEGQTEFWGRVLAARAGMRSRQETLDKLALDAAFVANRPGRSWKSLADSTNDAVYMAGHRVAWRDWQRREDYYSEGVLLWLDVDAHLRELTGGKRGLDDFAARFFHAERPDLVVSTYSFEDVCAALNAIAHDDWPAFLRRHLETHDTADAMAGLARAGWRLVYTAEPSETFRQNEAEDGGLDLNHSIGAVVNDDGRIASLAWDGPAFRAGLALDMRITAVAGQPFSRETLRAAVAATGQTPLTVSIGVGARQQSLTIDYAGGLRYPRLEPIAGQVDRLSPLLSPR
jgi:predicted metalloprotease with PDZ domain